MRRILSAASTNRLLQSDGALIGDRVNRFSRIEELDQVGHHFFCGREDSAREPHELPAAFFGVRNRVVGELSHQLDKKLVSEAGAVQGDVEDRVCQLVSLFWSLF